MTFEAHPLTAFAEEEYARQLAFRSGSASVPSGTARTPFLRQAVLLARGREEENLYPSIRGPGGAVTFFGERRIVWWSHENKKDRPSRHMASSQVSCVNFLLPLAVAHRGALVALLQAIDQDVVDVVPIEHEGRRSLVEFEWVGSEEPLEGRPFVRGERCTSIDALLLARTEDGGIRAYFLEWKYTESCGQELGRGRNSTRLARYAALYRGSGLFRPPLESLLYEPAYQLVRSLLLGHRTVRDVDLGATEARTIVVCPEANEAYRRLSPEHALAGGKAISVSAYMYEHVLATPERFRVVSQRQLLDRIQASGESTPDGWAEYHHRRYSWR